MPTLLGAIRVLPLDERDATMPAFRHRAVTTPSRLGGDVADDIAGGRFVAADAGTAALGP
jgi:hypothetical protein